MGKTVFFFLSLILSTGQGLTIAPSKLEEILAKADLIGPIEITQIQPYDHVQTLGRRSLATAKLLFSHPTESEVKIVFLGGENEDRGYFFSGYPRPYKGRRYQASLKKTDSDYYEIIGFEAGLVELSPSRGYSRNRTDGSNGEGTGAYLYWDSRYFPIPYYISEPTFRDRPELITEIDQSFATWRNLETIPVEFMALGCSNGKYNENDGLNSIIFVTKDWPFDNAAIAITRNFYVAGSSEFSGMILDSDIMLNAVDHLFSVGAESGKHDLRNILTHEVGHFLGLGHEINPISTDATMYAVASTAETKKQSLSTTDIAGIEAAYQGVGQKLSNQHSYCTASEQNNGCRLGVDRGPRSFPLGQLLCTLLVFLQIPLARIWSQRKNLL